MKDDEFQIGAIEIRTGCQGGSKPYKDCNNNRKNAQDTISVFNLHRFRLVKVIL